MTRVTPTRPVAAIYTPEGLVDLGGILAALREYTGLRQVDVTEQGGIAQTLISAHEHGRHLPSLITLMAYLRTYGHHLEIVPNRPRAMQEDSQ